MNKLLHCYIVTLLRKNSLAVWRNKVQQSSNGAIQQSNNGFTLIELIIVMAVISILSVIILAVIDPVTQIKRGNDTRRKSDLGQLQKVLEQYYQDNARYPSSTGSTGNIATSYRLTNSNNDVVGWGTPWTPYMNVLPKDPSAARQYVYVVSGSGQSYWLYASLERGEKDPQACSAGAKCTNAPEGACGGVCNYGVSSPNESP